MLTISFTNQKYFSISHLVSLISVIFSFFVPETYQNVIACLGILSFGILHGANDLKIIGKNNWKFKSNYRIFPFVLDIGVVVVGIAVFYFIPGIALLSFVLVSCYHFGEQHWEGRLKHRKGVQLFYFSYGAFIFLMLFTLQYKDTAEVIFQITSLQLPLIFFQISLLIVSLVLFVQFIIQVGFNFELVSEILLIGLLVILFYKATLLFGFGLYFVVWHSFPSLRSQVHYIYGTLDRKSFIHYFKSALLYWVMALLGLFGAYFFLDIPSDQYLPLFFSFLAAITFPHAIVMERMFSIPPIE